MQADDEVRRLKPEELTRAQDVMTRAFENDTLTTFIASDPRRRARVTRAFIGIPLHYCFRFGEVYTNARVEGAACWLPPGETGTFWRLLQSGLLPFIFAYGITRMSRFNGLISYVEKVHKEHAPNPHWYLWGIGVDPAAQGQGIGGRLMQPILERADEQNVDCYLETQNERNVRFYERYGFAVVHEGVLADKEQSLNVWAMKRPPSRD